jgi:hypothetical protein
MPNFPDSDPHFTFPGGTSDTKDNSAHPFMPGNDHASFGDVSGYQLLLVVPV